MLFKVNIKNLGKLTDAEIRIGKLTVFAGRNNTGKTFVSKALYSIFGAMNVNHLAENFRDLFSEWRYIYQQIKILHTNTEKSVNLNSEDTESIGLSIKAMDNTVSKLRKMVNSSRAGADEETIIKKMLPEITEIVNEFKVANADFQKKLKKIKSLDNTSRPYRRNYVLEMTDFFQKDLCKIIDKSPLDLMANGLAGEIKRNFMQNFMSRNLVSDLGGTLKYTIGFQIENIGRFFVGDENVSLTVGKPGINQLQGYSRVLYLESPFFWRFKRHLEVLRMDDKYSSQRDTGDIEFPKYFYDMSDALRRKTGKGKPSFPKLFNRLTEKVLGGKLVMSEINDELLFQVGDRTFPLHLSAVGVANLGMLALLMEYNLLDENTFLFIDEPEAHLHPAWQVEMIEVLYALSQAGVNVVIATHSADIIKWLEVHVKKHEEDAENIIALNHFHDDGTVSSNGETLLHRINELQAELTKPYYYLSYQSL